MDLRCFLLLLHFDICLGYSLVMSGSQNQESFMLVCTIKDAGGFDDLIKFNRNTTEGSVTSLSQSGSDCSVFSNPPAGYAASCGVGTGDTASQTKNYTLTINKVEAVDETIWWCSLQTDTTTESKKYRLIFVHSTTTPQTGSTTTPKSDSTTTPQTGESLDWCIAVSAVLAVLIVVGIVILILVVKELFDDKILKTLGIVLIVVGACVIVTAVVTAILLAVKTNVDRTDGSWIAAVVFCALGFLLGAVFCAVGVIKMSKLSKKDSKPVSGNSHELRNETGTPLNK